jgi:hypothetical protein
VVEVKTIQELPKPIEKPKTPALSQKSPTIEVDDFGMGV